MLGGMAGLWGCESKPVDPYSNMQMLSPAEAGVQEQEEDPVQAAERSFNAKFVHQKTRTR
jgi:hypothetical protein